MVKLTGVYPSSAVYPAGNEINIVVNVGALTIQSPSCYVSSETAIKDTFNFRGGQIANGEVYFGQKFKDLMDSFNKFGPAAMGAIENTDMFPCSASATAFMVIDGFVLGDPNGNIVGYCLNP